MQVTGRTHKPPTLGLLRKDAGSVKPKDFSSGLEWCEHWVCSEQFKEAKKQKKRNRNL